MYELKCNLVTPSGKMLPKGMTVEAEEIGSQSEVERLVEKGWIKPVRSRKKQAKTYFVKPTTVEPSEDVNNG